MHLRFCFDTHNMSKMFRIVGILIILSWISWTAAPVIAGLQDPAGCCRTCKGGFCPMTKAPKHSCHSNAASNCKMRSACDHSRDVALVSFDALLPEFASAYSAAVTAFYWIESRSLLAVQTGIDPPPPRVFAS
jgi:hypothetical protein